MKRHDVQQKSPEWFALRSGIPTVSEFGRIITPKTGRLSTQCTGYIADLIVETVQGPSEGLSTFYMDRGSVLEDEARSTYELKTDQDVEIVGLITNEWFGWSPDGLVAPGGLEIKAPKPSTHVKWLLDGELPAEHRPQCHGALIVGELEWLDFMSYCPGFQSLIVRVFPDDYTDKVRRAMSGFLEKLETAKAKIL